MVGFSNFYRYDSELVAVYQRFGTKPFRYREVSDIFPQTALRRFQSTGYLIVHKPPQKGRDRSTVWRLNPRIIPQCERAIQARESV